MKINKLTYQRIHEWLKNTYGYANYCENIKCRNNYKYHKSIKGFYHWAKLKNKDYAFNVNNFVQLCRICHKIYDSHENCNYSFKKIERIIFLKGTKLSNKKLEFNMSAGDIIKKLQIDHRITQNEIAAFLGCSQSAISNYLHGKDFPSFKICMRLLKLAKSKKIKVKLQDLL